MPVLPGWKYQTNKKIKKKKNKERKKQRVKIKIHYSIGEWTLYLTKGIMTHD
jgi:hypothetical protein